MLQPRQLTKDFRLRLIPADKAVEEERSRDPAPRANAQTTPRGAELAECDARREGDSRGRSRVSDVRLWRKVPSASTGRVASQVSSASGRPPFRRAHRH